MNPNYTLHIYKRVSSIIQMEGTSLNTQEKIGVELAKSLNMDYLVHNEGGQSSSKDDLSNRPVLKQLLLQMNKGIVKHLYVYNTDRLSRNQITWYTIRRAMVVNSVTLYTPKGVHNTNDSMENMILGILSEISQYDNSVRAERSRLGKLEKVRQNYWKGGPPPFGYMLQKELKGNKLVENQNESKWVSFIFSSYCSQISLQNVREVLHENNVKTRRGNEWWSLGSLQAILKNTNYIGIHTYKDSKSGEIIRNSIPAIITNQTFYEAKRIKERKLVRKNQISKSEKFYLLRDFLICKGCNTAMGGRRRKGRHQPVYYCPLPERRFASMNIKDKTCHVKKSININSADIELWDVIRTTLIKSEKLKLELNNSNFMREGVYSNDIIERKNLKKKEEIKLVKKKSVIEKGFIELETKNLLGEITSPLIYTSTKKRLEEEYKKINLEIEYINTIINNLSSNDKWFDWIDECALYLKENINLSDYKKRIFLNNVIETIEVDYNEKEYLHHLRINFRLPVMRSIKELKTDVKLSTSALFKKPKPQLREGDQTCSVHDYSTVTDFAKLRG